jgi:hypothetical protein
VEGVGEFLSTTLVDVHSVRLCVNARKQIGVTAAF